MMVVAGAEESSANLGLGQTDLRGLDTAVA